MSDYNALFQSISELVLRHSPSGVESDVDELLLEKFAALRIPASLDAAGNLIARIPGRGGGRLAITAHKDEIGASVTHLESNGRLRLKKLGGAYPWAYGEGPVDLLGDKERVTGILSFGSRHISHASPNHGHMDKAPVRWEDAWIETLLTQEELREAGIRAGTRMVVGTHRKSPLRLKDHIASYTLDNKASLAIILELAQRVETPLPDVYLIASSKEEIGATGALHFTQRTEVDALISLEVAPLAPEYAIEAGTTPVLLVEDSVGIYDEQLNGLIRRAADRCGVSLQLSNVNGFGSDGSYSMKAGHVARAACLGFPTQNTHGYEIAHLGALENCVKVLSEICAMGISLDGIS